MQSLLFSSENSSPDITHTTQPHYHDLMDWCQFINNWNSQAMPEYLGAARKPEIRSSLPLDGIFAPYDASEYISRPGARVLFDSPPQALSDATSQHLNNASNVAQYYSQPWLEIFGAVSNFAGTGAFQSLQFPEIGGMHPTPYTDDQWHSRHGKYPLLRFMISGCLTKNSHGTAPPAPGVRLEKPSKENQPDSEPAVFFDEDGYCSTDLYTQAYRDWASSPFATPPTIDFVGSLDPLPDIPQFIEPMSTLTAPPSPSACSTSSRESSQSSSVGSDLSLPKIRPDIGRGATKIKKKEGKSLKPAIEEDAQFVPCRWDDCGQMIPCDRGSVVRHMRMHIEDLQPRGLLRGLDPMIKTKGRGSINKCKIHCRWRDDVPCQYSDLYQSHEHKPMLKKKKQKVQKLLGRGTKKSEWARNLHFPRSMEVDEESDEEGVGRPRRSKGRYDRTMITVQSLTKHICATHLLCLTMTCEECDEKFSRADAYLRHRKEVHKGELRAKGS
ncbi:hypothetical protein AX15_001263 [Amanita polypyramis BW_CC]|nr:hypothetical protein AX15_001263 [Amanita polypyramis BW_CC]